MESPNQRPARHRRDSEMDYYRVLSLKKEPFSTSPDPAFFFQSRQHVLCLQKLELSVRMRRGLSVVIGEVGTGKTTLCRRLIRGLSSSADIETYLILDPYFKNATECLSAVAETFGVPKNKTAETDRSVKESVKKFLFKKGVEDGKTVVLIVDEGQKMPIFFVEILREFLNYETNEAKLLQIVVFAQHEFEHTLNTHPNFADRIAFWYTLKPMGFSDVIRLVNFRVRQAGGDDGEAPALFTLPALWRIYRSSGGYPRKIIHLCHQSLLTMIVQSRSKAGWFQVRASERLTPSGYGRRRTIFLGGFLMVLVLGIVVAGWYPRAVGVIRLPALVTPQTENKPPIKSELRRHIVPPRVDPPAPVFRHPTEAVAPPDWLGEIEVAPNETLGEIVKRVYGSSAPRLIEQVIAANPDLDNPHRIAVGQSIRFPVIHFQQSAEKRENGYFIEASRESTLMEAYQFIRLQFPLLTEPLRIIPLWNSDSGLSFSVVIDERFTSYESAEARAETYAAAFPTPLEIRESGRLESFLFSTAKDKPVESEKIPTEE